MEIIYFGNGYGELIIEYKREVHGGTDAKIFINGVFFICIDLNKYSDFIIDLKKLIEKHYI